MVYVFLNDGFEEIEAITPIDLMRRAGIEVKLVGLSGKTAKGSHGIEVKTDIAIEDVELGNAQMLVLPGGPAHKELRGNTGLSKLLLQANEKGVALAAICAAPSVLGVLGILDGKKGTCYPGFEGMCRGMTYTGDRVTADGSIITSRGAGTALDFALEIVKKLCSEAKANEIKASIQA